MTKPKHRTEAKRMWGGRFEEATDALVQQFNASIHVDKALALQDIQGSAAHATMLGETGILSSEEVETIIGGLESIRADVEADSFEWRIDLEDVHMNIEHALTERVGAVGGKLHTARSRNDQVATDFRLWLREKTYELLDLLKATRAVFVDLAEANLDAIMPGYTHLQVAQPILFSHHVLAYYEMFTRDQGRLADSLKRLNVSPLGAGALAGTGFPIDRARTAALLSFSEPARNSLDAVSDRDFALEFLSAASILMMHLSRLSEELILWSSSRIRLRDAAGLAHDGLVHHAAKEKPGRVRTRSGQDGPRLRQPHGAVDRHEGFAARLQQGHAGGQRGRV